MSKQREDTPAVGPVAQPTDYDVVLTLFRPGEKDFGTRRSTTWEKFFAGLRAARLSDVPKDNLPAWSPATFAKDHRLKAGTEAVFACVLDYDNEHKPRGTTRKIPLSASRQTSQKAALDLWAGTLAFSYSSPSHTPNLAKFRLVLPYVRGLSPEQHDLVRRFVWARCEAARHVLDPQCKDCSRLWYFGVRRNDDYRAIWQDGEYLDVDSILAAADVESVPVEDEPEPALEGAPTPGIRDRATRYLVKLPEAISGHEGHNATIKAALVLVRGFSLPTDEAFEILRDHYNPRCQPPWSDAELRHKVEDAAKFESVPMGFMLKRKGSTPRLSKDQRIAAFNLAMVAIDAALPAGKGSGPATATALPKEGLAWPATSPTGPPGHVPDGAGVATASASTPDPADVDIDPLLAPALGFDAVQKERIIEAVAKRFGVAKGTLRKRLAELEDEREVGVEEDGSRADALAEIISEIPVVRGADNRVFGVFGNHAIPLKSGVFKARIAHLYHERTGGFVSATTIDKVVLPLLGVDIARAVVPIRFAYGADGSIWVDLGDAKRFVRVTKDAVSVETACPIAFGHPDGLRALPEPTTPTDDAESALVLAEYRDFLRLDGLQFVTAWSWQVVAMRPMEVPGPREGENEDEFTEYTILKITGPEGTGKTTLGDYIRRPVDPRFPMHVGLPIKVEDISISGENARVLSYDNSSYIGQEHSNALARRATGDGNEVRELFTPRDQTITVGSNPVIITSIADAVTEPDLLSRCLSLDIDKVKRRTQKRKLKASFKVMYPRVFGALCYCVSRALRDLDTVEVPDDIRMQDSAQWALAAASAAGIKREDVLAVFARSVEQADAIVLERAVVVALLDVVKPETTFTVSMGDLHVQLTAAYEQRVPATGAPTRKLPKDWPDKPEKLRNQLKKLVPTLERAGVTIDWQQAGSRRSGRNITITRAASPPEQDDASAAPPNGRGLSVQDYGDDDGDGSEGVRNEPSPQTVTTQPHDSASQSAQGDGGDGGDAFRSVEKVEEREGSGRRSTKSASVRSSSESSSGGNEPSPPSPASPMAISPNEMGDATDGDGSQQAPAGEVPALHRAHVRDVRLEHWMPRDPDDWPPRHPPPGDLRLVVELLLEDGTAAYYIEGLHPIWPERTLEVLGAFGGDRGTDGRWVLHPVAVLVRVLEQFQPFMGMVPTVVSVSPDNPDNHGDNEDAFRSGPRATECDEDAA